MRKKIFSMEEIADYKANPGSSQHSRKFDRFIDKEEVCDSHEQLRADLALAVGALKKISIFHINIDSENCYFIGAGAIDIARDALAKLKEKK